MRGPMGPFSKKYPCICPTPSDTLRAIVENPTRTKIDDFSGNIRRDAKSDTEHHDVTRNKPHARLILL